MESRSTKAGARARHHHRKPNEEQQHHHHNHYLSLFRFYYHISLVIYFILFTDLNSIHFYIFYLYCYRLIFKLKPVINDIINCNIYILIFLPLIHLFYFLLFFFIFSFTQNTYISLERVP